MNNGIVGNVDEALFLRFVCETIASLVPVPLDAERSLLFQKVIRHHNDTLACKDDV